MDQESDDLDLRLLNDFQRDLPLVPQPFAAMAAQLGIAEAEVIARLADAIPKTDVRSGLACIDEYDVDPAIYPTLGRPAFTVLDEDQPTRHSSGSDQGMT